MSCTQVEVITWGTDRSLYKADWYPDLTSVPSDAPGVFAKEVSETGCRYFLASTTEEFIFRYNNTSNQHKKYHEIVRDGTPVKLLIDIECEKTSELRVALPDSSFFEDIVMGIIYAEILEHLRCLTKDCGIAWDDAWEVFIPLSSCRESKYSFHLVLPLVVFPDRFMLCNFTRDISALLPQRARLLNELEGYERYFSVYQNVSVVDEHLIGSMRIYHSRSPTKESVPLRFYDRKQRCTTDKYDPSILAKTLMTHFGENDRTLLVYYTTAFCGIQAQKPLSHISDSTMRSTSKYPWISKMIERLYRKTIGFTPEFFVKQVKVSEVKLAVTVIGVCPYKWTETGDGHKNKSGLGVIVNFDADIVYFHCRHETISYLSTRLSDEERRQLKNTLRQDMAFKSE